MIENIEDSAVWEREFEALLKLPERDLLNLRDLVTQAYNAKAHKDGKTAAEVKEQLGNMKTFSFELGKENEKYIQGMIKELEEQLEVFKTDIT